MNQVFLHQSSWSSQMMMRTWSNIQFMSLWYFNNQKNYMFSDFWPHSIPLYVHGLIINNNEQLDLFFQKRFTSHTNSSSYSSGSFQSTITKSSVPKLCLFVLYSYSTSPQSRSPARLTLSRPPLTSSDASSFTSDSGLNEYTLSQTLRLSNSSSFQHSVHLLLPECSRIPRLYSIFKQFNQSFRRNYHILCGKCAQEQFTPKLTAETIIAFTF